jgi:hypothetical protein
MHAIHWWSRLQFLKWADAWKRRPAPRAAAWLLWWAPCVLLPATLAPQGRGAHFASAWLLSIDVPLALLLAGCVTLDSSSMAAQPAPQQWLWPRGFDPALVRWMARLRWLHVLRWPAGLVIAALLLRTSAAVGAEHDELFLIALLAGLLGLATTWVLVHNRARGVIISRPRRAVGMAALSWSALHDLREHFDLRRVMVLSIPVLLSAPMGALASEVAGMLAWYLPTVFIALLCRESTRVQSVIRRWLPTGKVPPLRLTYWIWRHVALGITALCGLALLWSAQR